MKANNKHSSRTRKLTLSDQFACNIPADSQTVIRDTNSPGILKKNSYFSHSLPSWLCVFYPKSSSQPTVCVC